MSEWLFQVHIGSQQLIYVYMGLLSKLRDKSSKNVFVAENIAFLRVALIIMIIIIIVMYVLNDSTVISHSYWCSCEVLVGTCQCCMYAGFKSADNEVWQGVCRHVPSKWFWVSEWKGKIECWVILHSLMVKPQGVKEFEPPPICAKLIEKIWITPGGKLTDVVASILVILFYYRK